MKELLYVILILGFLFPVPPGLIGGLLYWYIFGGKKNHEENCRKWQELDRIESELNKEGKTIYDEVSLARKGKSKYFKSNEKSKK